MSSSTPSRRGLGVPMREREDKDTQDGIKPPARPRQTPLPHMKPPSFVWNVVCVSAQKSYRLSGISPPHRLFPTRHPPRKDKNIIAKLPRLRRGSFNLAYTDRALSSLKSLEWIDGLDAAVHLPIVQVFGENLVATGRFRRRKHEGVIELDSVKTLDFKCALRQPKGAVHHA